MIKLMGRHFIISTKNLTSSPFTSHFKTKKDSVQRQVKLAGWIQILLNYYNLVCFPANYYYSLSRALSCGQLFLNFSIT